MHGYFWYHNCATHVALVAHTLFVPQNVAHISCFLLKHQRGDPLNISNFYTFSDIFSLFSILYQKCTRKLGTFFLYLLYILHSSLCNLTPATCPVNHNINILPSIPSHLPPAQWTITLTSCSVYHDSNYLASVTWAD